MIATTAIVMDTVRVSMVEISKISGRINVTNACNLSCKYCYVKKSEDVITLKMCTSFIDKLLQLNNFNNHVTFFGGEPSLCGLIIEKVLELYIPKGVRFSIVSNGYFVFDQRNDYIMNNIDNISISLEGCEASYNVYRGSRGLSDKIEQLCNLDYNIRHKINVNMSLNNELITNVDEFIVNYIKLSESGIRVHIYSIHGDDGINSIEDFFKFFIIHKRKML